MKKKEAKELGLKVGEEILKYGDFTIEELQDEDLFIEAYWEIWENRKQYADSPTYSFKYGHEWDGFEEGGQLALERYLKKQKIVKD